MKVIKTFFKEEVSWKRSEIESKIVKTIWSKRKTEVTEIFFQIFKY